MRKIFENMYVMITEIIVFLLSLIRYLSSGEIEPIIGMVVSGSAIIGTLIFKFTGPDSTNGKSNVIKNKGDGNIITQDTAGEVEINVGKQTDENH